MKFLINNENGNQIQGIGIGNLNENIDLIDFIGNNNNNNVNNNNNNSNKNLLLDDLADVFSNVNSITNSNNQIIP